MTLTTAQQVRLRIQDLPQVFDLTQYGDGSASAYQIQQGAAAYRNVVSASAYVPGANGTWTATGAAFNASGYVTFSAVISANSAYRVRGVYSTFSEDEIGHFTAVGGNIAGAAKEAARALQFDALKRASWAAPDGTTYDDTKAMDLLKEIIAECERELQTDALGAGGFQSWSINQGNW